MRAVDRWWNSGSVADAAGFVQRALSKSGRQGFLEHHEAELSEALEYFAHAGDHNDYQYLARQLYSGVWEPRLRAAGSNVSFGSSTEDEIRYACDTYLRYFAAVERSPALGRVAGKSSLARQRSRLAYLDAVLCARRRLVSDAVRRLNDAVSELNTIAAGSVHDLADICLYRSTAATLEAFAHVRKRTNDFITSAQHFARAARFERRREHMLARSGPIGSSHFRFYVQYWKNINLVELETQRRAHRNALRRIKLAARYGAALPNFVQQRWFDSPEDVAAYEHVILAHEALDADPPQIDAVEAHLSTWLGHPAVRKGNGRYLRVKVRELAIHAARDISGGPLRAIVQLLEDVVEGTRALGPAEMYIRDQVRARLANAISGATLVGRLREVFALSSTPPTEWAGYISTTDHSKRRLEALPALFARAISDQAENAPIRVGHAALVYVRVILEYWSAILEKCVAEGRFCADVAIRSEDFRWLGWSACHRLAADLAAAFRGEIGFALLLEWFSTNTPHLSAGSDEFVHAARDLFDRTSERLFPLIVLPTKIQTTGRIATEIEAHRIWARDGGAEFRLSVKNTLARPLAVLEYYYVKPRYKTLTRSADATPVSLTRSRVFGVPAALPICLG